MTAGGEDVYYASGRVGLEVCERYLGNRDVRAIIDFPSGHGRVMRWFKLRYPNAKLYAVEVDPDALAFVSQTFGAEPVVADGNLEMALPKDVDLIFSGSLLTHLDDWQWRRFLEMSVDALATNGLLVFSTHGRAAAILARQRHPIYGELIDTAELYRIYEKTGFAFLPYSSDYPTYGLTLSSPQWVMRELERLPFAKIVAFEEQGWGGGHQDIVVVQKNAWPLFA